MYLEYFQNAKGNKKVSLKKGSHATHKQIHLEAVFESKISECSSANHEENEDKCDKTLTTLKVEVASSLPIKRDQ